MGDEIYFLFGPSITFMAQSFPLKDPLYPITMKICSENDSKCAFIEKKTSIVCERAGVCNFLSLLTYQDTLGIFDIKSMQLIR